MSKTVNSIAVANYFIELAREKNDTTLSPLKLQKLIYFSHAWYLAFRDNPLINEAVEAWPYGPVIPSVYHTFKSFGNNHITELGESIDLGQGNPKITTPTLIVEDVEDKEIKMLLDEIWDKYGHLTPVTLSNMTHADNTSWHKTIKEAKQNGCVIQNLHIPDDYIKKEFKGQNGNA